MKRKVLIMELMLAAGLLSTQLVFAGTSNGVEKPAAPAQQSTVSTFAELDALRSQNAILAEQVKKADLENKLSAARISTPSSLQMSSGSLSKPKQTTSSYIDRAARVQLVAGIGGKLTATIQTSEGGNTVARVGSRIPNLGIVRSIKTEEVIVENGKELYSVPFASEPVSNATQNSQFVPPMPQTGPVVPPISTPAGMN